MTFIYSFVCVFIGAVLSTGLFLFVVVLVGGLCYPRSNTEVFEEKEKKHLK